ncbi:MAG TPA: type II toxin-antitoxin system VapC family toxin [Terriglobales bacterium]|jgi:predicted nucleic acid-binding protein|nr:type II toxin-antitoxin system VapC family toxin [Terriglobales bacterium]
MSRIYWDTMLFVYWLEDHPRYAKRVRQLLEKMRQRQDQLYTSSFTVGETLVGFYKTGSDEAAREVREIFRSPVVEVIPYTLETADFFARIRAKEKVSPVDAIHLACAAQAHIDLFLTNDTALVGKVIPGIQFIAGIDPNII